MKPESLEALLVDRELGELPAEVTELLDSYLELAPDAREHAEAVARTVGSAREAVRSFPELAQGTEISAPPNVVPLAQWFRPWIAHAAAIALTGTLGVWLGYRAGTNAIPAESARVSESRPAETLIPKPAAHPSDLWARYNVAFDHHRGTFTIAVQP